MRTLAQKNNHTLVILGVIIMVAVGMRLLNLTTPLLDWHSFRQSDTASVSREYSKHEINILYPRYHDLGSIQSGVENPMGWRMVELPIRSAMTAALVDVFGSDLVITERVVSIFFSITTLLAIFYLAQAWSKSHAVALLSAAVFALMPYSIFYSRTVLPEPVALAFGAVSLALFVSWLRTDKLLLGVLSATHLAVGVLIKPYLLFWFPVYASVALSKYKVLTLWQPQLWLYCFVSVIPFLAWREWITQFPAGIPASDWLMNGNGIRFRPAWFRWLGYERLIKMLLGFIGIVFLPWFVMVAGKLRQHLFWWWVGILLYFSVFASGNVQHDYYQVFLLPVLSISLGVGMVFLIQTAMQIGNLIIQRALILALLSCYALSVYFGWMQIEGFFAVNHPEYVLAGEKVNQLTPPDAKVIAPAFGDTAFLFQTQRTGWPIGFDIEAKIAQGATHYITTSYDDEARLLEQRYVTLDKTDEYLLLDLTQPL